MAPCELACGDSLELGTPQQRTLALGPGPAHLTAYIVIALHSYGPTQLWPTLALGPGTSTPDGLYTYGPI